MRFITVSPLIGAPEPLPAPALHRNVRRPPAQPAFPSTALQALVIARSLWLRDTERVPQGQATGAESPTPLQNRVFGLLGHTTGQHRARILPSSRSSRAGIDYWRIKGEHCKIRPVWPDAPTAEKRRC